MPPFAAAAQATYRYAGVEQRLVEDQRMQQLMQVEKLRREAPATPEQLGPSAAECFSFGDLWLGALETGVAMPAPPEMRLPVEAWTVCVDPDIAEDSKPLMPAMAEDGNLRQDKDGQKAPSLSDSSDSLFRDMSSAVTNFLYGDGLASGSDTDEFAGPPAAPPKTPPRPHSGSMRCALWGDETPSPLCLGKPRGAGLPLGELPVQDVQRPLPPGKVAPKEAAQDERTKLTVPAKPLAESLGAQGVSTVMLRNVPASATQAALLEELDLCGFSGLFDFCYLPREFETRENKGYAFINFASRAALERFTVEWNGSRRFGASRSERPLNVSLAAVQGLKANVRRWGARMNRVRNTELRPFIAQPASSQCLAPTAASAEESAARGGGPCGPLTAFRPPPGLPPAPAPAGSAAPPRRFSQPIGAPPPPRGTANARHRCLR